MGFYFITGLPRCRTAWLANLLTYGPSFCFHELIATAANMDAVETIMKRMPFDHVGVSDSGMAWVWRKVAEKFPEAKVVTVLRPALEAAASHYAYFTAHPFPGIETPSLSMTELLCKSVEVHLDVVKRNWAAGKYLEVQFHDLHKREVVQSIWDFLVPNQPFNEDRWAVLDKVSMNLIPEKHSVNPVKFAELIGDA